MSTIDKKQVQHIHIGKSQLGWTATQYRNNLMLAFRELFGDFCLECDPSNVCAKCKKVSCLALSYKQATVFLNDMKAKGFELKRPSRRAKPKKNTKKKRKPSLTDLPSKAQSEMMRLIANDIRWTKGVKLGLQGFCMRMLKVPWPQTAKDASKMIEYLKKMRKNQGWKK